MEKIEYFRVVVYYLVVFDLYFVLVEECRQVVVCNNLDCDKRNDISMVSIWVFLISIAVFHVTTRRVYDLY